VRTAWALKLSHAELGIEGVADVVEYHKQADGTEIPFPIEYKRAGELTDEIVVNVSRPAGARGLKHGCSDGEIASISINLNNH